MHISKLDFGFQAEFSIIHYYCQTLFTFMPLV